MSDKGYEDIEILNKFNQSVWYFTTGLASYLYDLKYHNVTVSVEECKNLIEYFNRYRNWKVKVKIVYRPSNILGGFDEDGYM